MELIERYLQAVSLALPEAERDDIIKELRDSILSQVEEQEETLARPLNEDEEVALLKKLGSPARLASRYRKQQHVIGSTTFPIYWKVLKLALGLAFLVLAAGSVALAASGKPFLESLSVLFRYPSVALSVFGWITLAFFALEFFGAKYKLRDEFDPRKLPAVEKKPTRMKSRFELIAKLVTQVIFSVWWLAGLHYQYLILGPGVAILNFGPIWRTLYPLFVAAAVVDIARTAATIYRPSWRGELILTFAVGGLGFVTLCILATASDLFVAVNGNSPQMQAVVKNVNFAVHLGLRIAIVVRVITLLVEASKLIWKKLNQAHQVTAGSL